MASALGASGKSGEGRPQPTLFFSQPVLNPWPTGYVDVGLIPVGAREIRIVEVAEAANFLALRSEDPD